MAKRQITLDISEKVKTLGISGSPRKAGNTAEMVKYTLKAAESMGYVETEFISLADYHFGHCTDRKKCIGYNKPADDPPMCCEDPLDKQEVIRAKQAEADGVLLGWPVYVGYQPALVMMSQEDTYTGGSPFFNEAEPGAGGWERRYKPRALISQSGQSFAGQERTYAHEATGHSSFTVAAWPTADAPEPQSSFMGGMLTCVDGMSVYAKNAWTSQASWVDGWPYRL